jgi:hypothetical protein
MLRFLLSSLIVSELDNMTSLPYNLSMPISLISSTSLLRGARMALSSISSPTPICGYT